MCGIIAYTSKEESVTEKILTGLHRLEPRGYDSRGIAVLGSGIYKDSYKGEFKDFISRLPDHFNGKTGIAHTRWATHGEVNDINSHPHFDAQQEIYVVHNGVIQNYRELINEFNLSSLIVSETDSEVVPHIISYYQNLGDSFLDAFKKTISKLKGAYGIVAMNTNNPGLLLGAKKGSPLYIGKSEKGYFISSAQTAFYGFAHDQIGLDDGELCIVTADSYEVLGHMGEHVSRIFEKVESDYETVDKGGYEHFMLKEIEEAPEVIQNTLRGRVFTDDEGFKKVKLGGLASIDGMLPKIKRIIIVGCGTAYHAGLFGKYLFETYARIPTEVYIATDFVDNDYVVSEGTAVIAISQSGTTKDTIDAIKKAKKLGLLTLGIVNVVGSDISQLTDAGVYNHAGPEVSVASTKALNSQLLILGLMSVYIGKHGLMRHQDGQKILEELSALEGIVTNMLSEKEDIMVAAKFAAQYSHGCFVGSNVQSWVPYEAALKLREISYLDFMGFPASELKHGSLALVDETYLTIALVMKDKSYSKVITNISTIKSRKGPIISFAQEGLDVSSEHYIAFSNKLTIFSSLLLNIQLQRFSYYMSNFLGREIDKPRNLAKTVTVD